MAHAAMLAKPGILTQQEKEEITAGLQEILKEIEEGTLRIIASMKIFTALWKPILLPEKVKLGKNCIPEEAAMTRWLLI